MYNIRKLTDELTWIGVTDRKISKFENVYKIDSGMNYNSYFLDCGATVLFDTVGNESSDVFFENLDHCLNGRALDYVVIHHMEPDHSATLAGVLDTYAGAKIIVNAKTLQFISQFFPGSDYSARAVTVKDGDEMELGSLADGKDFETELLNEARRYYTNIVGKYGMQTVAAINKVSSFDIKMICPLHSYVWRRDLDKIIGCYKIWGSYTPEVKGVFILAGSIYGHTANAAEVLMTELDKRGIDSMILDASVSDISDIIAMAFKYSHIVIASPTYNNNIYSPVEYALSELAAHGLTGRSFSVIENGTWAPAAAKGILAVAEGMKNCKVTGLTVTIKSSGNDDTRNGIEALAEALENDIKA